MTPAVEIVTWAIGVGACLGLQAATIHRARNATVSVLVFNRITSNAYQMSLTVKPSGKGSSASRI